MPCCSYMATMSRFEAAALRAAQIGFDLGIDAMAFFQLGHRGAPCRTMSLMARRYEQARTPFSRFVVDFAKESGADHVHVIAHSMGKPRTARCRQSHCRECSTREAKHRPVHSPRRRLTSTPRAFRNDFRRIWCARKSARHYMFSSRDKAAVALGQTFDLRSGRASSHHSAWLRGVIQ